MNFTPMLEAFFEAGERAAASDDAEELHTFRIAAKRLRYTLEILEPEGAKPLLVRLKRVQRQLGDMNDCFVAERFLRDLPQLSPRARPLPSRLHLAGEEHIATFRRMWPRTFSARGRKGWIAWSEKL